MEQAFIEISLWDNSIPASNGLTGDEIIMEGGLISNISHPVLKIYPAKHPTGKAIIMCPGGGFTKVAMDHEGESMAGWFNEQGITYTVLKYRLPNGHREIPIEDMRQAICIMRKNSKKWGYTTLGVMGASIGGFIAAYAGTLFTGTEHPDFQILLYPVISMKDNLTHLPSRTQFLGEDMTDKIINDYSLECHVSPETPPTFIALASDDKAVSPLNSIVYYTALLEKGIPAGLHIYPEGGHGFGFRDSFIYKKQWTEELKEWLKHL